MKKRLLYLIYSLLFFLPSISLAQISNHVVISELYGAGGNTGAVYTADYIELYNPTGADVDMSGWSVQYNSAAGTGAFSGNTTFPAGSIIKSHGYYLIAEQSGGTAGVALPTPDIATSGTTNNFNMSGTAGKIALVNNSTTLAGPPTLPSASIIDFVGYGTTAVLYEGTGPATAPSTTTSIERKTSATSTATTMASGGSEDLKGNGYDSDNNANDFIVPNALNPQNSASPLETPGSGGGGTATPTLTVAGGPLDFGTSQAVGTTSAAKTFTVSGSNLTAGATITTAAPYAVSVTGAAGSFATTATIPSAFTTAQTIYVQFTPTNSTVANGTVTVASTGAATQTVNVTGTGASTPTLTASQTSLTFASQAAGTTSAAQTFTLSGSGLSTNTSVSVAAPFAVSKDGISYSNLLTYTPTELSTAQTVSVVFSPTAGGSPTATINISSTGATSKSVALSGTATAASGGGGSSSAANHVVISELYGAGGNTGAVYTADYIELYNPTGADVDMSGWSVQYNSAAGTGAFSGNTTFPAGSIIKSHGYYLIAEQSGGTAGVALPTPDIATSGTTNNFNMSGTAGKIALVNNSTTLAGPPTLPSASIIDFVGYGTTAVLYEGTGPATAPSTTTSIERKTSATSTATTMASGGSEDLKGNGYDTDNNANDFIVPNALNPQNSASPLETPAGGGGGTATATPTLTVATSPATSPVTIDFGTQSISSASAAKTFTLTGSNLTAGATITTAAPFAVSLTGAAGSFGTTATIPSAFSTPQTIYVQFAPTTSTSFTGSANVTSSGATGQGVILMGVGSAAAPVASLTATPTSLAFGNLNAGTTSVKTFALSGANLSSAVTASVAAPYTISSDGTTYGATATFTAASVTAGTATASVKFAPTAAGASNTTVTITDPDVTTPPSVTVTGTGVVPVLTATTTPATSPTSIDFGTQTLGTSAVKTYSLSGTNLTGNTTVTVTGAGYLISKDGSTYATSFMYNTTELSATTPPSVYVQFTPATSGASPITGSVANTTTGTGATTVNVPLTGIGSAIPVPTLTATPSPLTFSAYVGSSAVQTYTLSGVNLTGTSTVTTTAPYLVSKDGITYSLSVTYSVIELATPKTVSVKFSPTVVGSAAPNTNSVANTTTGTTTVQTVVLNGTGVGVPVLAVATTPPSTPANLTFSQIVNTTSAPQSYTLTGTYITAPTTVTVTGAYMISKTSTGGYGTSLTYTAADMASPQTVYVVFTPTAAGTSNGTITNASTNAVSQTVALNGTGLGVPALTATPGTLTFIQGTGSASAAQTFTISAVNLLPTGTSGNVTVTAPAQFTISKDGASYFSSLMYTATELATTKTVSVIFTPTAITALNGVTGNITVSTTGATTQNVVVTGTGINSLPTLAVIADPAAICYTTAIQSVALTGITPGSETTQTAIASVTSNTPAFFSSLGLVPGTSASTAAVNFVVAPGQTGTAVITVTVKDNGGTANGAVDNITRSFTVTVKSPPVVTVSIDQPNNILQRGTTATLTASGAASYVWTTTSATYLPTIISPLNNPSIQIRPSVFVNYKVTGTTNGCSTDVTYTVEVATTATLETSNVITPNGDGKNDFWVIRNIDLYPGNTVKVMDRSGKVVYSKTGYNNDWNGYYNGSPLTQGSYYYVVDLGQGVPYRGVLSIVRD